MTAIDGISNKVYCAKQEETFEAEWDSEAISSDEANSFVAQIDARIVAQRDAPTPASERIYNLILDRDARTMRTRELLLELHDPKNDSI